MRLSQVGEVASSKSAMNTLAPELRALIIILRSTGPVISTRRSVSGFGASGTIQSAVADLGGLGQEVGAVAGVEAGLSLGPGRQQIPAAGVEPSVEPGDELDGLRCQDPVHVGMRQSKRMSMDTMAIMSKKSQSCRSKHPHELALPRRSEKLLTTMAPDSVDPLPLTAWSSGNGSATSAVRPA